MVPPWLRFHIPLIEPDRQISRIRLSDKTSRFRVQRHLQLLNIPPRSFLVSSAIASEDKIHRMAAATTIAALSGYGHNARDVRELLHLLHQAGHALYELGEDLLGGDDDEGNDR